ncbi:hypothetical protein [Leeuwenhoekiella marinoflava]|uniref:Uncharacterized protein n=2 Tax=Leeuwenhoekiella marinoflava TaxID=988 RepID=A0A4Q0PNW6_9FLAO|nr:hypothetical protein [Leeuwenhoekiella marinoflava]RXG32259.1 hypothetical protein DSL99_1065 [Leeuwenhoekiella marinoflava]SHE81515.1 hypothetical protein SAMN02745246_01094 [Leeuwenhoekiella marinoflava DSM 3653]
MKTKKHLIVTTVFLLNSLLFIINSTAQTDQRFANTVNLDTVNLDSRSVAINQFVSDIITDKDFKYRKALRESKSSKKHYTLNNFEITETDLLKHFKKAARKSDSVAGFARYFQNRNLSFIAALDQYVLEQLYNTIRQTTFNGFLDNWQKYY